MNVPGSKLSLPFKSLLFAVGGVLTATGAGWLVLHYRYPVVDEFGARPHPAEKFLLQGHGAAAMGWLLILGALLQHHVRVGLRHRRRLVSGLSLLGLNAILIVTGYGLYYAGDERLRAWASWSHSVVGGAVVLAFALHLFSHSRK